MKDLADRVFAFATTERTVDGVRAALIVAISLVVSRYGGRWVKRIVSHRGDLQRAILSGRLVAWLLFLLGLSAAFEEMGFKLHVLLGAAGVLSVAVGFAAQTTLSNLISGFFLFGERPFHIGDSIEVDGVQGEVLAIDMLATVLRTADYRFVRIPNETLVKTKLTNQTRFTKRRVEIVVPIASDEDFEKARVAMLEAVKKEPRCLPDPEPVVFIAGFTETSVQAMVWVWVETANLIAVRAALYAAIHAVLGPTKRTASWRMEGLDRTASTEN